MEIGIGILAIVTVINFLRNPGLLITYLCYAFLSHIVIGLVFLFFGVDTSQVQSQGSEFEIWLFGGGMAIYGGAILFFNFVMLVIGTGEALEERELQREYAAQDALWKNEFRPGVETNNKNKSQPAEIVKYKHPAKQPNSLSSSGDELATKPKPPARTSQTLADMLRPLRFVRTDCNCDKCGRYDWCSHILYEEGDVYRCDWCEGKMVKQSMYKSSP